MDRPGPRPGALTLVIAAALLAAVAGVAAAGLGPLRGERWLAAGADTARALGTRPAECLRLPRDPEAAYRVEVGRAAFRTPLLLGGQAARAGLACETCHKGGHANPDFDFPGVSGAPGTADVTSSLFSSHRGDGVDNPKPIPDLGGPKGRLKVSQAPEGKALERFIDGLVTQEFDGPEPPAGVIDSLAAYVRAMDPAACPSPAAERIGAAGALDDARRAVRTARQALGRGQAGTAALMIGSARSQLGLIYERYDGPALGSDRLALTAADRALQAAADASRSGASDADALLAAWLAQSGRWSDRILADEPRSLFAPRRLDRLKPEHNRRPAAS